MTEAAPPAWNAGGCRKAYCRVPGLASYRHHVSMLNQQHAADLVVRAAHAGVRRMAAEELPVFAEVAAGWRRELSTGRANWSAPGGAVGFGIDTTLLTELVLQAVAAAVGEVLVVTVTTVRAGLLRRRRPEVPAADDQAPSDALPTLDQAQLVRLRDACRRHAVALGLDPDRAALLADAAVGAMVDQPEA